MFVVVVVVGGGGGGEAKVHDKPPVTDEKRFKGLLYGCKLNEKINEFEHGYYKEWQRKYVIVNIIANSKNIAFVGNVKRYAGKNGNFDGY